MDLPIYLAEIDDEEMGAFCISLVSAPATECNWQAFEKEEMLKFSITDEEKRMVRGVFMCADQPIYRRDEHGREYYIKFSPEVLRKLAENFLKNGYNQNVDLQHDGELVDGVFLQELFIKDTAKGISPVGYEDLKDGSLFCQYHITNDDVWEQVKKGEFHGFSLAGIFNVREEAFNDAEDAEYEEIVKLINEIKDKIK